MKNLILILLLSIGSSIAAQDTLSFYVTGAGEKIPREDAKYLRKVVQSPDGTFLVKDYYMEGQIQMTGAYLNDSLKIGTGPFEKYFKNGNVSSRFTYKNGKINGKSLRYFDSGPLKSSIDIVDGKKHGKLNTYWKSGTKKREDNYMNGVFIQGICYNKSENKIEHFPFMVMPKLPGEKNSIQKFLQENVNYPSIAKTNGIQGKVIVNFTVGKKGEIREIRIRKRAHPLFNEEALRVVNAMPTWIPGKRDGDPFPINYNLPISFQLRGGNKVVVGPNARSVKSYNKATKFFVKKEFLKAISHYSDAISWYPKYTKAYLNRAISYARLRDIENACKDWKKCAELGNKDVQNNIDNYCK